MAVPVDERLAVRGVSVGEEAHESRGGEETLGEFGTVVGHQRVDEVVAAKGFVSASVVRWRRAKLETNAAGVKATPCRQGSVFYSVNL